MRKSPPFAWPANSTSDPSGTSNALWRMTWQDRLMLFWCSHTWINATHCFLVSHHSILTSFSVYRILLPGSHSVIGIHLFSIIFVKIHWRFIHSCINVKISSLTFKLLSKNQPANLKSLWHRMLLLVCWGHLTSVSSRSHKLAHQLANVLSLCASLLFGTQYHCTFGFLRNLHRSNETWKLSISLHLRPFETVFASDSAIYVYSFI